MGVTADNKTFVFNPNVTLGSAEAMVWYTELTNDIELGGQLRIHFPFGGMRGHSVSTELDLVPPTVESVIPLPNTINAKHSCTTNYSEAINPISAVEHALRYYEHHITDHSGRRRDAEWKLMLAMPSHIRVYR